MHIKYIYKYALKQRICIHQIYIYICIYIYIYIYIYIFGEYIHVVFSEGSNGCL